jgi:hypothetical protein
MKAHMSEARAEMRPSSKSTTQQSRNAALWTSDVLSVLERRTTER